MPKANKSDISEEFLENEVDKDINEMVMLEDVTKSSSKQSSTSALDKMLEYQEAKANLPEVKSMLKKLILIPVLLTLLTAADCNGYNQKNYASVYDFTNRGEEWTYNNTQALIQDNLTFKKELKDIKSLIEVKCK